METQTKSSAAKLEMLLGHLDIMLATRGIPRTVDTENTADLGALRLARMFIANALESSSDGLMATAAGFTIGALVALGDMTFTTADTMLGTVREAVTADKSE